MAENLTRQSTRISVKSAIKSKENIENISHVMNTRSLLRKRSTVNNGTDTNKTDEQKHSPPKQKKSAATKVVPSSPTTLLGRLSLDNSSTNASVPTKQQSKYANAKKVLNINESYNLPGRERELAKLSELFDNSLSNQKSASIYISGPPGTGKTSCVMKLLNESFGDKFKAIYLNCTGISTIGSIYKRICEELKLKTGTEKENLSNITNYITKKTQKKMVLLLLDEIDQLSGKKQSVLYTIFEWPALVNARIVLVGIANALDLTDRLLTRLNTNCELKPQLLHFACYTKQQIIDIFKSRLEEAGVDIFPPATIQLLAAKMSAVSGDIRRALDIGRRVIEYAATKKEGEQFKLDELGDELLDKTEEKVKFEDVISVLNSIYGSTAKKFDDASADFPLQHKIIICTFLMILKNDSNKDITIGRSHIVYSKICTKRSIPALDQSEYFGLCTHIQDRGIIKIIKNKVPKLRKIQLQWDESEVIAALHDKQLISEILSDTSCLGKS